MTQKIIESLKEICKQHIKQNQSNKKQVEIYQTIEQILEQENAFLKLDAQTSLNILNDLLKDQKQAYETYILIINNA